MKEPDPASPHDDADLLATFAQTRPPAPSREFTRAVLNQLPPSRSQARRRVLIPALITAVIGLLLYPELRAWSDSLVDQLAAGSLESHTLLELLLALAVAAGAWLVSEYDWLVD